MDPRERILTALRHEEPDVVPIDFGAMASTGIMAIAYAKLKKYLGMMGGTIRVFDVGQQLAEPEKEMLDIFHVDVINLTRTLEPAAPSSERWREWKLPDGTGCEVPESFKPQPDGQGGWVLRDDSGIIVSRMSKNSLYFEGDYHPLKKARGVSEVKDYGWTAHRLSDSYIECLRQKAEYLNGKTRFAILFFGAGSIHEWGQGLRGWSTWLADLTARRNMATAIMDEMIGVLKPNLKRLLDALQDNVQLIGFGDDMGVQTGPQMSARTYREMIKTYHSELFQYVKKHSKLHVFLHSCGSIYDLMPDLIDAGVDALNPVQISAKNMEPQKLKREFGDRITFWGGGVDTQNIFGTSTPKEVEEHVRRNVSIFTPGGGYVFNQVHNVQVNVPPENVVAAYKAAHEYKIH